jgi:hypothetical protein
LVALLAVLLVRINVFGATHANAPNATQDAAQTRDLPSFRNVELAGSNNVTITIGPRQSVVVHADRKVVRRVTTRVVAGTLVIDNVAGGLISRTPMRVEITMPFASALTLAGSGVIDANNMIAMPLKVKLAGRGLIRAGGSTTHLAVTLSGSGDAQLDSLVARDVDAVLLGSGRILVNATNRLNASVPGSGAIVYVGHPAHLNAIVTGSGAVVSARAEAGVS